ncbi:MAG: divergent PAP2 family protein [Fusobacteriaceae bacterium]
MKSGMIFNNRVLDVIFTAWALAQGYKVLTEVITKKKLDFSTIWGTGGMPSSHSSTVTSLATSVGIINGFNSVEFAIAATFTGIVMYDAAGIRRAAGKQAGIINRLLEKIHHSPYLTGVQEEKLKELLGHTPLEVLVGGILGITVAFLMKSYLLG